MATGTTRDGTAAAVAQHHVRLRHVTLRDFRNIGHADLDVPAAGVVLVGRNGHGKTNLLEALHYLHAVRSTRGAADRELIRFGADAFHIAVRVVGARIDEAKIGVERATGRKRLVLDGAEVARMSDAVGAVPSIVLSPRDVALVNGAPQERRRFVDIVLAATSRRYLSALQRYRAALVRRNAAMRESGAKPDGSAQAAVWEPALAEAGAILWRDRAAWAAWAAPRLKNWCAQIGESGPVVLRHHSSGRERAIGDDSEAELRQNLSELFSRDRAADLRRGLTHHGPHRDDFALSLDGRLARTFGSGGQQRTMALALRIVEAETLRTFLGRDPVLLLDDPFAELDRDRAGGLLELLQQFGGGQRILAVPRDDDVPAGFTALPRWSIESGVIRDA